MGERLGGVRPVRKGKATTAWNSPRFPTPHPIPVLNAFNLGESLLQPRLDYGVGGGELTRGAPAACGLRSSLLTLPNARPC